MKCIRCWMTPTSKQYQGIIVDNQTGTSFRRRVSPCIHTTTSYQFRKKNGNTCCSYKFTKFLKIPTSLGKFICCSTAKQDTVKVLVTSYKGGGKCICPHLSACLLARLLKNACMDLDEMLRVNRCWDMDELMNF